MMKLFQTHLMIVLFIFLWTTCCFRTTTQEEDTSGSSFFFYQQSTYPRDCREVQETCSSYNSTGVFMIKPDGYLDPFEVYCGSADGSSGWTVIQRRFDDSIGFRRDWGQYASGFGFLSQEYWLGNERLSFLTNQKRYQLMIEMTIFNGSLVQLVYDNFRISDDFSNYTLVSVGQYSGSTDSITLCGANEISENCSTACQRSCGSPEKCLDNICFEPLACVCPDGFFIHGSACVPAENCGCYELEEQTIVPEGSFYVSPECMRKGECINGQIIWDEDYECSYHAECGVADGVRQCNCNEGYTGDGQTCTKIDGSFRDCQDIYEHVSNASGVYEIKPINWTGSAFDVYCNMTDGGGWTVFQRRVDGSEDFYLGWEDYKIGFGNLVHEFWLGNDKIHFLTNQKRYEIKIDLVNTDEVFHYASYDDFLINDMTDNYRLSVLGSYTGTAGDCLSAHLSQEFSTNDQDNDDYDGFNCAGVLFGAWWFYPIATCAHSNLNGQYDGFLRWLCLPGSNDVQFSEMKVRPVKENTPQL